MRSLWAGVTGLQAHQIAMDVEGNNIANVNTTGFKYSRANFSDLLSQTSKIATAPQGELGGKNAMQIGLGTQISSVTKIFKQGSIETTDKNTDLAIQGDGFFVVSPDGGSTYKYSRNGDFTFDATGNFTESNGYIIQGWMRDDTTGDIDSTAPIRNITIPPGLTTPANETSFITLKANLNSGISTVNKTSIYELDSHNKWYDKDVDGLRSTKEVHNENANVDMFNAKKELVERGLDMSVVFDANGQSLNLRDKQGVWASYASAKTTLSVPTTIPSILDLKINGETITGALTGADQESSANQIATKINEYTSKTGVVATVENGTQVVLTNNNERGTEAKMKNIDLVKNATDNTGFFTTKVITAYQYTYSSTSVTSNPTYNASAARQFNTTEDLRAAMQKDAREYVNYSGSGVDDSGASNTTTEVATMTVGVGGLIAGQTYSVAGLTLTATGAVTQAEIEAAFASLANGSTGGVAPANATFSGALTGYSTGVANASHQIAFTRSATGDATDLADSGTNLGEQAATLAITTQGHKYDTWAVQKATNLNDGVEVTVNAQGQFQIANPNGDAFDEQLISGVNDIASYRNVCNNSDVLFPASTVFGAGVTITAPADKSITLTLNGTSTTIAANATYTIPAGGATLNNEVNFPKGTSFGTTGDAKEVFAATFGAAGAAAGETVIFDGITYTNGTAAATANQMAAGFTTAYNANPAANWVAVNTGAPSATVTFTRKNPEAVTDIVSANFTGTVVNATTAAAPTTQGAAGIANIDVGTSGVIYDANTNKDDQDMTLFVTQLTNADNDVSANVKLATSLSALQGSLIGGSSIRTSQNMYAANHASSIDVYDSLGSKHTVRVEFTKVASNTEGSEWSVLISVDEPGQINYSDTGLKNIISGSISFNSDGSLASPPSPSSITYSANNGSAPNQNILLEFGTPTQFNGMTSFDKESNTSGISQDGYSGGDLSGVRVDETGTLIGSFTNGRSFGLAQVAMAKFSNNEGLESDGGNTFVQTSNSGDPIIGQAALGGRGFIQASALEMSNVDLSRSLTQLIVIQRGYQANSKTITTADQLLQTLLSLKQ